MSAGSSVLIVCVFYFLEIYTYWSTWQIKYRSIWIPLFWQLKLLDVLYNVCLNKKMYDDWSPTLTDMSQLLMDRENFLKTLYESPRIFRNKVTVNLNINLKFFHQLNLKLEYRFFICFFWQCKLLDQYFANLLYSILYKICLHFKVILQIIVVLIWMNFSILKVFMYTARKKPNLNLIYLSINKCEYLWMNVHKFETKSHK